MPAAETATRGYSPQPEVPMARLLVGAVASKGVLTHRKKAVLITCRAIAPPRQTLSCGKTANRPWKHANTMAVAAEDE